jgi:uncharacterized protein YbjT (DUF2867 family)
MTDNANNGTTLVLGGTGKTGRRIVSRLRDRGLPVRVGSRAGDPAFDWEEEPTWGPALDGVSAVYLSYQPDLAVPPAAERVGAVARLAAERGIERQVLISGRGEEEAQRSERVVREASPTATVVRASWFSQNFSESFLVDLVLAGVVALPAPNTPEPFVDTEDIADVATAALTEAGHAGRLYELTGPRMLTFAEAVGEIADASGRPVEFVRVDMDEFEAELVAHQLPADYVWLLRYLFSEVLDGRNASITDGVEQALGRPARDFADYARETAATGVWDLGPTKR